jgi:hypothetical protein
MGNILAWGDHPIPQPINEFFDLESFTYDRKMKLIVEKNSTKREMITLDNGVLCTFEEVILDTKKAKMSELVSTIIAITHASFVKVV